jgi:thiamine biosynthesis lipoprotein
MLHKKVVKLMGNRFEIGIIGDDAELSNSRIDLAISEIQRIEKVLTTFSDDSVTCEINRNAGIKPVVVPGEVFQLIERSIKISELTQGAFDISYGGIDTRFWNFDTSMTTLPDASEAKKAVRLINYKNIVLNHLENTVFLKEKGMRIGFGGIGKGYAAEKAKNVLQDEGVESGFVNAAGDLTAWGFQEDRKPWTIGIASPTHKDSLFASLNITNTSVATSGNYEKYVVIDGKRYSHTIDPKTGFPVSGIKSVTIITHNAELADAMATPVMVMGKTAGMYLINQIKGMECIIIDDNDKIYFSSQIKI